MVNYKWFSLSTVIRFHDVFIKKIQGRYFKWWVMIGKVHEGTSGGHVQDEYWFLTHSSSYDQVRPHYLRLKHDGFTRRILVTYWAYDWREFAKIL